MLDSYYLSMTIIRQLIEMEQHLSGKNFVEAQAIKDATMAESIVRELNAGKKVFHLKY